MLESAVLDHLDHQVVRALQLDPRASFSLMAEVLGVSEQTVARRYRRLRGDGYLRVMGLVSPRGVGVTEWLLRVGCRPGGARRLADALARREDVSWVSLSSGGSEIVCVVRSLSEQQSAQSARPSLSHSTIDWNSCGEKDISRIRKQQKEIESTS